MADGVNVGYDVFEIVTEITQKGAELKAKEWVDHRDRQTRKKRWSETEEDNPYTGKELDRSVVNTSQIRQVIQAMKTAVETQIFPARKETPKTLIFAKTDSHADDIINIVREVYGQGNAFCKKVTYRAEEDADSILSSFRNDYNPRIAVTVDMIATGNVLFEGGAGEKIRRKLLETCDVHTILRLPTGIFYAQGVKANVVFFDNAPKDGRVHTKGVWFYDLRTNRHFTLKTRTLKLDDLQDFIACYHPENRHERKETERFKYYRYKDLIARDKASLDIFWLKDESLDNLDDLPPPDVLQLEIIEHLEAALLAFRDVAASLPKSKPVTT